MDSIEQRLEIIHERMVSACARCGRKAQDVTLVAVSKTYPSECVVEAALAGQKVFGESRIQEASAKLPLCPEGLVWHLIGHLQRNKVRRAVELFSMIHSVDSLRLLESIDNAAHELGRIMPVCVEVNVSGESSKFGVLPEALADLLVRGAELKSVEVVGLMTMPPWSSDAEAARPCFRALRDLRDDCERNTGLSLRQLSMGMSHDFEVAIEEGATLIRVGTDIFGER